jgi:hypothetical protein
LQERLLDTPVLVRVKTGSKHQPEDGQGRTSACTCSASWASPTAARVPTTATNSTTAGLPNSDVPGAKADEFVHPQQASLDDVPFDGKEQPAPGQGNQEAHLRERGCICEEPVKVELKQAVGHVDCPLPGHAPF